jgi:hypothetical protein
MPRAHELQRHQPLTSASSPPTTIPVMPENPAMAESPAMAQTTTQGGPVRLAILLVSIAGLLLLAVKTSGGSSSAPASIEPNPGQITAVLTRRPIPPDVQTKLQAWNHVPPGATAIDAVGSTYAFGGYTGPHNLKPDSAVRRRDGTGPYQEVAKLPVPVSNPAVAHVGARIYTFGGEGPGGPSRLIEEHDVATKHTIVVTRLAHPITRAAAVSLGGFIYILGGMVGKTPSRQILRFDPFRQTVAPAGRLQFPMVGGRGVTSRAGVGYVVGGTSPGLGAVNLVVTLHGRHGAKP